MSESQNQNAATVCERTKNRERSHDHRANQTMRTQPSPVSESNPRNAATKENLMSATLRYTIGINLASRLPSLARTFGYSRASIIDGVWCAETFDIELPSHIKEAVSLLRTLDYAAFVGKIAKRSAVALARKLRRDLGLPAINEDSPEERHFLTAIYAGKLDAGDWLIYADWLEERGCARAEIIRAWNAAKRDERITKPERSHSIRANHSS